MTKKDMLNTVGQFAAPLVTKPGMTPEDVLMVAGAFLAVAEEIFKHVGGKELAAQQFYQAADRCAAGLDE